MASLDDILEELEGTEEDTWFPKPLGRDITIKGLDNFVKTFMKKYGGIINAKTPKRHFDKIIKKYVLNSRLIQRLFGCSEPGKIEKGRAQIS